MGQPNTQPSPARSTPAYPAAAPSWSPLWIGLALLITLLGLGLRFYRLDAQSLWTDEVSSLQVARAPLDRIWTESAVENNSLPTYFLLLRAVVGLHGNEVEWRARALSALAGTLSIPAFMGVVWLWRRHREATLVAGLLLATNPLHIWYSQEVRAYALMLFFGLLSLLCFELARERRKAGWWAGYIASAIVAIALHKTALVFPALCILWQAGRLLREGGPLQKLLPHLPIILFGLAVFLLKSHPPLEGYGRRSSPLEIGYTFMTFVGGYSFGPSLTDLQTWGPAGAVTRHLVQVGILGAVLLLAGVVFLWNWRRLVSGREFLLLALGIGIVAVYALVSRFPFNVRYTLSALLAFLALLALYATDVRRPVWARASLLAVLLVGLWADAQWFYRPLYGKADARGVAQWLSRHQDRIHSWTVLPGYLSHSVEWYLERDPAVLARCSPAKEDQSTSFPPVPDALIIGRRHHVREPDKLVAAYAQAAGEPQTVREFTGFEIYTPRLKTPGGPPPPAP